LHGSILPEADVIGLVTAGEEDDFRLLNEGGDLWIIGIVAFRKTMVATEFKGQTAFISLFTC